LVSSIWRFSAISLESLGCADPESIWSMGAGFGAILGSVDDPMDNGGEATCGRNYWTVS
jgi:hypothetical protein